MAQNFPTNHFLLECIYKLHERVAALENIILSLVEHRHDDFGRVFASDGVTCRYLGGAISQGNLQEPLLCLTHPGSNPSAVLLEK